MFVKHETCFLMIQNHFAFLNIFYLQLSSENENNHVLRGSKPSQYLKDKSSKRKSSLNRIDFIDSCTGKLIKHS